jgi:hypothetical protein
MYLIYYYYIFPRAIWPKTGPCNLACERPPAAAFPDLNTLRTPSNVAQTCYYSNRYFIQIYSKFLHVIGPTPGPCNLACERPPAAAFPDLNTLETPSNVAQTC